jgi:hypothetical protein
LSAGAKKRSISFGAPEDNTYSFVLSLVHFILKRSHISFFQQIDAFGFVCENSFVKGSRIDFP